MHVAALTSPLLRPSLFARTGFLRLHVGGLTASACVGSSDRQAACPSVGNTFDDIDKFLERFDGREPTRIKINPRGFSLSRLRVWLAEAEQFKATDEAISVDYGLPKQTYDYAAVNETVDGLPTLSQHLVLVAFDGRSPVGYAGMTYSITDVRREQHAGLCIELHLVYVDPRRRGEGYGLDLSVAVSWAARDLLRTLYSGVRSGTRISSTLEGDFESKGGEAFYDQVFDALEVERDLLLGVDRRRVDIDEIEYEAGW